MAVTEPRATSLERARELISSSPRQTFLLFPALVLVLDLARGKRPRLGTTGLALMAAGYALYRVAGAHRNATAGGHGMESVPTKLVTDGPYAVTRNPMYLGHLLFMTGLVIATRSPVALGLWFRQLGRFRERVARDEARLEKLFGEDYRRYRALVPRWLPTAPRD